MAGEFDFEPVSDEALALIGEDDFPFFVNHNEHVEWSDGRLDVLLGERPHVHVANMARELRKWRERGRAWTDASDMGDLSRILPAEAKLRALVAHVGGGE